jgi:hypothetical protein
MMDFGMRRISRFRWLCIGVLRNGKQPKSMLWNSNFLVLDIQMHAEGIISPNFFPMRPNLSWFAYTAFLHKESEAASDIVPSGTCLPLFFHQFPKNSLKVCRICIIPELYNATKPVRQKLIAWLTFHLFPIFTWFLSTQYRTRSSSRFPLSLRGQNIPQSVVPIRSSRE